MQRSLGLHLSPVPSTFDFPSLKGFLNQFQFMLPWANAHSDLRYDQDAVVVQRSSQGWNVTASHQTQVRNYPDEAAIRVWLDERYAPESEWL